MDKYRGSEERQRDVSELDSLKQKLLEKRKELKAIQEKIVEHENKTEIAKKDLDDAKQILVDTYTDLVQKKSIEEARLNEKNTRVSAIT